jgi:hypothetical protein
MDARKGFPDDMLEVKRNALFYVHGRSLSEAVWSSCCALMLVLMVVGALHRSAPTMLGADRSGGTAAMAGAQWHPTNMPSLGLYASRFTL